MYPLTNIKSELKKRYTKYYINQNDTKTRVTQEDLIKWIGEIWYDDKLSSEMIRKSFKTVGITLALDRNEDKMHKDHNPLLDDDQVMDDQVEQPADEQLADDQDEGMKDAEIDDNNYSSKKENDEEKEAVGIDFTEQKANPENYENTIDIRWSDIQREDKEDITKVKLIESLQKQTDE